MLISSTRFALAAVALLAGCGQTAEPTSAPTGADEAVAASAVQAAPSAPAVEGVSFEAALAALDETITRSSELTAAQPESWMRLEIVANLYLQRARLGGDLNDYAEAEALLEQAFELAPEGSGPLLSRAQLNYSLHRIPLVAADLDAASRALLADDNLRADLLRRQGNLAMQTGDYGGALDAYEASLALHPSYATVCDLAQARRRTGDYDAAEALFDRAEGMYHGLNPEPKAWLHLQRAILDLDRGSLEAMLSHLDDADGVMTGWWLVDEHRAEALTLLGRADEAEPIYVAVIEGTGKPEYMDAMAEVLAERGDEAGASAWIEKGEAIYEAQLAQFPEAAAGHALGHYLAFGPEDRALALARANAALRPNGEARIQLAEALLASGEIAAARVEIEAVLASAWRSPELYEVAGAIYDEVGEPALAEVQREAGEGFGG